MSARVLNRSTIAKRAVLGCWCVVLLFLLSSCDQQQEAVPQFPARVTPPFNHAVHVVDEEIQCKACHATATTEAQAGMPDVNRCIMCHKGVDPDLPEGKRSTDYVKDGKAVWYRVTKLPDNFKFDHAIHAKAKIACADCHGKVEESKEVNYKEVRVTLSDCVKCHQKEKVAQENCKACHTDVDRDLKPESHNHNWEMLHGAMATMDGHEHGGCQMCHTEKTCTQCHRDQKPKNHDNHFRRSGHGVLAELDRTGCMVCHSDNSCVRCHKSVAPRSHRAGFKDRHCLGCHLPLRDNSCNFCHKGTPSHLSAPSLPATRVHTQATEDDCRVCHGGLKRPHADNGESCLACHSR